MRRKSALTVLLVCLVLFLSAAAAQSEGQPSGWTPQEMMKVPQISELRLSPDGASLLYCFTKATKIGKETINLSHIFKIDLQEKRTTQLTFGTESCRSPRWSPDGRKIAFISDRGGPPHIRLLPATGGESCQLTDVKSGVLNFLWSPDGSRIAFTMMDPPTEEEEKAKAEKNDAVVADENLKMVRLWVVVARKDGEDCPQARLLTKGEFSVFSLIGTGFCWSPDGKNIAFTGQSRPAVQYVSTGRLSRVEVATGVVTPLVEGDFAQLDPLYSPDGKWIAFFSGLDGALTSDIDAIPSNGGKPAGLAWTSERSYLTSLVGWSKDSRHIIYKEDAGVSSCLRLLPVNGDSPKMLDLQAETGNHVLGNVVIDGSATKCAFTMESPSKMTEIHVSDLGNFKPLKVSDFAADIPRHPLGKTETIRWKAKDGLEIEGLLTYPAVYEKGTLYPLLLYIHGGPSLRFDTGFIGRDFCYPLAAFSSQGYFVLRCNIRGSIGYGVPFKVANIKDLGGRDYEDLMAGVDYVIGRGLADPERLGVMGWSYGGYMTSWIITQTGRFKAASVGAGITNFVSMVGTSDSVSPLLYYLGGHFWDSRDLYLSRSAIYHVKSVKTPTLIQHGDCDERVPTSQGVELYNALKALKVPVKMVRYPRSGHCVAEPKLLLDVYERNVEWFNRYVPVNKP